jgi:hypothetical protein
LPVTKPWPDPLYFYALPTRDQAKRVAWGALKALVPPAWIPQHGISETELSITTIFGSKLVLLGMDKPARAEGVQYDGGVVDECSDQRPGVFERSLGPAMTHRNPWCWRIGVPKRAGVGAVDFKEAFDLGLKGEDPDLASYTWPSSDILSREQLRFFAQHLDPRDYNEQYNASWESVGGMVFHCYSDVHNVADIVFRPDLPILVGSDFNVDPMCWVLAQSCGGELKVFDEIHISNCNTQQALNELHRRYGTHENGWRFYGDASGRARHTSAAKSDYLTIRGDERFKNARVYYPLSNPSIADRFAACNAMFENALGIRRMHIHPRCVRLRKDLLVRAYKEGTREPQDPLGVGHITDALGYIIHQLFPVRALPQDDAGGKGISTVN